MKIEIRPYNDKYVNQIVKMMIDFQIYLAGLDSRHFAKPFDNEDDCRKYLLQLLKDSEEREGVFYVAVEGNKPIGFVQGIIDRHKDDNLYRLSHFEGDHGWVGELYVSPEYRNQGVAKKLVEAITQYFKENSCVNVRLNAMAGNKSALAAYEKMGFKLRNVEMVKYDL